MFALGVITKFLSFIFIFLAYKFYRLPENRKIEVDAEKQNNGNVYNMKEMAGDNIANSAPVNIDGSSSAAVKV